MSNVVLDASALLTLLNDETGADKVRELLPDASISAVNLAEVVTRLSLIGMPGEQIREVLTLLGLDIMPFDEEQAFLTGLFAAQTHSLGLSLGDRACLALASVTGATAVTADRAWKELDLGVKIQLVR
ncbi:MAG: type II toxin-antitoxin system VapC family toxin [Anaerolineales bacterium]|nr:type II toxin-antitoxin system VapC family toxin [Anaerolineales bacterium]